MRKVMLVGMMCLLISFCFAGEQEDEFFNACRKGDVNKVKELLEKGMNTNIQDKFGISPLMIAVGRPDKEIALLLIANGANVNSLDSNGRSVMDWAELGGNPEILEVIKAKTVKKTEIKKTETTPQPVKIEYYQMKDPTLSWALSFFLPAVGQYYNGDIGRGVLFDGMYLAGYLLMTKEGAYYNSNFTFGILLSAGAWLISFVDAPLSSTAKNEKIKKQVSFKQWNNKELGLNILPKQNGFEAKIELVF